MINTSLLVTACDFYHNYPAGLTVLAGPWRFTQADGSRASITQTEFGHWLDDNDLQAGLNFIS